ncbi:tape measure protein [Mycobacterium phage Squee]|nr:tape measure protein [Mycobacterium phage Fenn]QBI99294.1 tape measure protein [Mycobacterium phage Naira]
MAVGKEVGRLSIKVTPDLDGFYRQLKEAVEAAEKMKVKIPVEPDMGNFRAEVAAKTRNLPDATVRVKTDVDKIPPNKLANMLLPSFGSGINPAGYAAIFAGILVAAAPAVGIITTALLALPGIVAAIATPIGAIALGLDGIKAAAEKVKPQFDALKKVMSDVAETQFTPVFERAANTIFPALEQTLPRVTQGLADLSHGVLDAFSRPENMEKFRNSTARIGEALSAIKPGVDDFTSGIINLIDQLTQKFPGLTDWINGAGSSFKEWTDKISNGDLSVAFDNLGASLRTVLDFLGELGEKGLEFMKDPQALDGFLHTLEKIGDTIQGIVDLSAKVNENWQNLVQVWRPISAIADVLQGDLSGAFNTTKDLFTNKPFLEVTEQANGAKTAVEGVGEAAKTSAADLEKLFLGGGNATGGGGSPLDVLKDSLSKPGAVPEVQPPNLEPAKAAVSEYQQFIDGVTQQVRGALSQATSGESLPAPNFEAFKAAWNEIPTFVTTKGNEIEQAGKRSADGVANSFQGLSAQVAPHFEAMRVAAVTAFDGISASAGELPGKIEGALGSLAGIGNSAGLSLMSGLTAGMQAGEGAMLAYVGTIADKIAANKGPLPYDRKVLVPAGEALMEGLGTGLESGLDPVLSDVRSIAGQIFQAFKDTFGTAPQALALNLGGLQNSLTGVQTTMQSTLDTTNDLSTSLTSATSELATGSSLMADDAKRQVKDLQDQMDLLELQKKQLKVQKNEAGSKDEKAAIQDKIDALQAEKDKLAYQKDQLKIQQKQTGELGEQKTLAQFLGEQIASTWEQGTGAVAGFARSNLDQAMSDLGIGGGAITNGLNAGLDWGVQALGNVMNIQVNSVDDAIAVKNNEVNKQALTYTRR